VKTRDEYKRELFTYVCEKFRNMFAYEGQFGLQSKRLFAVKTKHYYIVAINVISKTYILRYQIDDISKKKVVVLGGHINEILITKFDKLCRKGFFHGKIE
jgi:hypothetical protein